MIELTRNVAFEMADKCIRINTIAQGAIATDINKDTLDDLQKKKQEEQVIQIHRIAQPQEVVKVALFLVSSNANYVTDIAVYADGWITLSS
jgi:glucose 1-dehydrogenase